MFPVIFRIRRVIMRIKRKLKTVHDPKMGSTSAGVQRKTGTKKTGTKKTATNAPVKRTTKKLDAADKDFNNKRRKVLKDRAEGSKAKAKGGDIRAQFNARKDAHAEKVKKLEAAYKLHQQLQEKRKDVQLSNLKGKQKVTDANLKARFGARLAYAKARKPVLKDGKITLATAKKPVYTPKKFAAKPMPRIGANGKIVTTAKPKKAADPDKKAGAKRGAKTKDKGGAKAAS
jgi:hypothetical protein